MKQQERYKQFYKELVHRQLCNYPVAHRGILQLHESEPENSLAALKHCINEGVLFIEIDLQKTKDGVLVLMHDTTVDRMTNGTGAIANLTLEEIKSLNLYQGSGEGQVLTDEKIPTFEEALSVIKGKALANVDKGWEYRTDVYQILKEKDAFPNVLIKSDAPIEEIYQYLQETNYDIQYMHKVFSQDVEQMDDIITKLRPLALEVSFFEKDEPIVATSYIQHLQESTNVWLNALDVSKNAGLNDSLSLKKPDQGWGWLIGKSPNLIQTDFSLRFNDYKVSK
jgi:glycerophosphoryl diester phosphodiesterase